MEPGTTANQQLEFELAVLRAVPDVIDVATYPKSGFKPKDLKANKVVLKLRTSDGNLPFVTCCGADCASWLEAARDVNTNLSRHLGRPVVVAAEESVKQRGLGAAPVLPEPKKAKARAKAREARAKAREAAKAARAAGTERWAKAWADARALALTDSVLATIGRWRPGQGMEACNVVAIALFRVALTSYEEAVGPLVKAWAKRKCAVLH